MRNPNDRCILCNLFMSYDDMENSSVVWEDDEWAHLRCWNSAAERFRASCKPHIINEKSVRLNKEDGDE